MVNSVLFTVLNWSVNLYCCGLWPLHLPSPFSSIDCFAFLYIDLFWLLSFIEILFGSSFASCSIRLRSSCDPTLVHFDPFLKVWLDPNTSTRYVDCHDAVPVWLVVLIQNYTTRLNRTLPTQWSTRFWEPSLIGQVIFIAVDCCHNSCHSLPHFIDCVPL